MAALPQRGTGKSGHCRFDFRAAVPKLLIECG